MKILYLISSLKNGGPVNMLYSLIKNINRTQFDITLVVFSRCKESEKKHFSELNVNIVELNSDNQKEITSLVQRIVDNEKPQIIHSHGGMADLISTKLKGNHSSVSTVHCEPYNEFRMKKGFILGTLKAAIFIHNMKRIEAPIACSETVANNILQKCGCHISYIRNGIDVDRLNQKEVLTREALGIPDSDTLVVFCGYLSKRKNVAYVIEAFNRIERHDLKLLIIGDGEQMDMLREKSNSNKQICFVGKVDNPIKYLRICDYFISASLSEGLPLAVMEGLGCGLIPLLSKIDSHEEIQYCCDGVVKLFDNNDVNSLISILNKIERYPENKNEAKEVVYRYLNAKRMACEYENLYKKLGEKE